MPGHNDEGTVLVLHQPRMTRQEARDARLARRVAAEQRRVRRRKLRVLGASLVAGAVAVVGLPLAMAAPSEPVSEAAPATSPTAPAATSTIRIAQDLTAPAPAPAADNDATGAQADKKAKKAQKEKAASDSDSAAQQLRATAAELPVLSEGDSGKVVATLQRALNIRPASEYFGPQTKKAVKKLQAGSGLPKTGKVATWTWSALGADTIAKAERATAQSGGYVAGTPAATATRKAATASASAPPVLEQGDQGEAVAVVQRALDISPAEGFFGPVTAKGVKEFQASVGLPTTGVVAEWTWKSLGANTSADAATAHATYGTKFGPGAPTSNSGGSSSSSGSSNSGGSSGSSSSGGSSNSGGGSGSVNVSGRFCPADNFSYGDGMGAARGGGRSHAGLDLMGSRGTPIYAIDGGTVTRSGYQSNGAMVLDITGSRGMMFYGHFDSITVGQGQSVKAGQVIGYMGDTGSPGAVHLHLEVRPSGWSGGAVDPVPLIRSLCG